MLGRLAMLLLTVPTVALAARGDLDSTFGNGGKVSSAAAIASVTGLGLQSDGRIVVATSGPPFDDVTGFSLFRYGTDGTLDTGFGGSGTVTEVGEFGPALLVDADGSLVVAGTRCDAGGCVATLRRYDADGHPAPAFAASDLFVAAPTVVEVVARQADGKLIVGGNAGHAPFFTVWLARYNADGTSDGTFGNQGVWAEVISAHGSSLGSLLVRDDGSLTAGTSGSSGEGLYSSLRVVTPTGGETASVPISFAYPLLALAPGGALVSAGSLSGPPDPGARIALARFGADLQQDAAFGDGGLVTGPSGSPGGLLVQPGGDAIVAAELGDPGARRFAVLAFTADGALDAGFASQGVALPFADQAGAADRVARQADGKLVAAGRVGAPGATVLVLARFLDGDPAPSTTTSSTTTTTVADPAPASTTTLPTLGPPCTDAAECDDGDACTVDACGAGACLHTAAVGFDTVTCLCASPALACDTAAVTGRMEKACSLLARAGDARVGRARRLIRRALHLLARDQHAMARQAAPDGRCDPALARRVEDLQHRTRQLLQLLR